MMTETARSAVQELRRRAVQLGEQAREQEKRASRVLEVGLRQARAYLREQPLHGAGIALAAGLVIGGLLLRR
jgi:ElaB/YqjD/DUF883 family membrane-anchored ribosome-binding protein